ncbi:MAG: MFS transporter [Gordonia sp. (in: high G+C Gram-positive bacteria)]
MASLRTSPGLGRLLAVRLGSQATDGIFQAALLGGVLFNPERHSEPLAAALGFAVLLLPYSVIGPFAGALLDRWDRRAVLLWANVVRAGLMVAVAVAMASGSPDLVVLIAALSVTGASRFVMSGLSASLPHVAHQNVIVATNALVTTLGGAMLAAGAGIALWVRGLLGSGNVDSALTTLLGIVVALLAAWIARGFPHRMLGPDVPDDAGHSAFHAVAVGFGHGMRAVAGSRTTAAALSAIGLHRLAFGMNTLMLFVFARHLGGSDDESLARIGLVLGCIGAGSFLAAITTPVAVGLLGRRATLFAALALGAVFELTLLSFSLPVFCVAAFVLGLIGQTAKLNGDVAMQVDIGDTVRGQVFSVQDAVFNIAYVLAMIVTALTVPDNGRSAALIVVAMLCYVVGIGVFGVLHPRRHGPGQPGPHRSNPGAPAG